MTQQGINPVGSTSGGFTSGQAAASGQVAKFQQTTKTHTRELEERAAKEGSPEAAKGKGAGAKAPKPVQPEDSTDFSDELKEEKEVDEAGELEEEFQGDEQKLKALDERINQIQQDLDAAIQAGDLGKAAALSSELGSLLQERNTFAESLGAGQQVLPGQTTAPLTSAAAAGLGSVMPVIPSFSPSPAAATGRASGGTRASSGTGSTGAAEPLPPGNLTGNDKKTAAFIDNYLAKKGSPAAGKGAGELMVKAGKKYKVDPLILLSIAGHETGFGKLGVGMRKMLGVGAYDSNPGGKTPYDGLNNQIVAGAKTFARLRAKGGSGPNDSLSNQLAAANRGGWATDQNWHNGVARWYNRISADARAYG